MIDDREIEDFLEHYGVKGQKWGVRKANGKRTGKQKLGIAGAGLGSYVVAANLVSLAGGPISMAIVGGGAAAALGVHFTRDFLDSRGDTHISELPDRD